MISPSLKLSMMTMTIMTRKRSDVVEPNNVAGIPRSLAKSKSETAKDSISCCRGVSGDGVDEDMQQDQHTTGSCKPHQCPERPVCTIF